MLRRPSVHSHLDRLLLFILLGMLSVGCAPPNTYQAPPPPEVTVANPIVKEVSRSLFYTGTTEPVELVQIRARVSGFIDKIAFEDGVLVEENQLLYVIEQDPFSIAVRQAKAAQLLAEERVKSAQADFNSTKAEYQNAQAQLARGERAAQGGAVTQGELDDLRTTRDTAYAAAEAARAAIASSLAEVEAAKAEVAAAELDLSYTEVRSPIAGRVGETLVDRGNLVGASDPTHLTTVIRQDPINAYFAVNENDLLMWRKRLGEGKGYRDVDDPELPSIPIFIGLANEEGYPHEGVFDYGDPGLDRSTGTLRVRGEFANPGVNPEIPLGAFVRVRVPLKPEAALLIDERAVGRDQQGSYVLVVEDVDGKPTVQRKAVEVGESYERMRIINSGLEATDRVVVNGLQRARPGAVVSPIEAKNDAGPTPSADPTEPATPAVGE